jgi:putative Holliday junction resolvase
MKLLGIDYGTKRVGIATADLGAGMAFPKAVIKNDDTLLETVKELCQKEGVEKIILGESKDLAGKDNAIAPAIAAFKEALEKAGLEVVYQREFYTTYQASRIQGDSDMIDASAAAIILQSYLEKIKN